MSIPKYIYVDDENDTSIESLINGFNDTKLIEVNQLTITKGMDFSELENLIKSKIVDEKYDGLLIDLRLDGEGPNQLRYSAISISSELRAVCARKEIPSFPIVLCSTLDKMKETYKSDKTSHDLFDYTFRKSENPDYERFSRKLKALAEGYKGLPNDIDTLDKIFQRKDLNNLDQRIFERFYNQDIIVPYDFAHFTVKTLFHATNPLIKETILAARLGVSINKSGKHWIELLSKFEDCKFYGLFSNGWDRWWADLLNIKLKGISGKNFSFLKAEERVAILKETYKVDGIIAAEPLSHNNSSEFWTICEATKCPLDPLEGFKVRLSHELKAWQEPKYMSLYAILERIGIDKGIEPNYTEIERIEECKRNL
ncbi:hypothetical protein LIV57_07905 [Chryseobacterium sp. X308]|uniref:hypothetical protein n=1 Tax=Chryseobacterium sp. X308 TaxID=2884873 RepID=UPI001D138454|nr:hypothetical protein [Chryseobacterium sp. X308]MCC3215197.1 hypothetical protein [Chryseobacterium sp. X308]